MAQGWLQIAVFLAVVLALTKPLGVYMAGVYRNERVFLTPVLGGLERLTYRDVQARRDIIRRRMQEVQSGRRRRRPRHRDA